MNNLPKIGLPIVVIALLAVIMIARTAVNIGYGEAGVVWKRFGGGTVTDKPALGEGFHIVAPWNKVYVYDIKQQEEFESGMRVLSSNGLEISLDVSKKCSVTPMDLFKKTEHPLSFLNMFEMLISKHVEISLDACNK